MHFYDAIKNWRRIKRHLADAEFNLILIEDFNKYTYGQWREPFPAESRPYPRSFESCAWQAFGRISQKLVVAPLTMIGPLIERKRSNNEMRRNNSKLERRFTMITSLHRAMDLMRRPGSHLIQTNGRYTQWYIAPHGARVDFGIAKQIVAHPQIRGDEDCLWPGLSQTWRMR
jgi:hypothetical protein